MSNEKERKFNWRGWTSFLVALSFVIDTISGIILYISPPGRIANWTNWTIWGLDKEEWVAVHTIFGYLLLIIIAVHLYYNWKIFINYIWSKMRKALNLKREFVAASVISLVVFLGSIWSIPPFGTIMDIGENFKNSWEESKVELPVAHAELMSLENFSATLSVPVEKALEALKSSGYKVRDTEQTLGQIAQENNTSPDKLYEAIKSGGLKPQIPEGLEGSGLGKKKLRDISSEKGLSLDEVISRLKEKGITAKPDDKLKDLADKNDIKPVDLYKIVMGTE